MKELLTYWPQLLLLVISVISYGIKELWQHNKIIWMRKITGFWGQESWRRKYKGLGYFPEYPTNFYYRFFKIKYKERFPLSATLLVFVTDGAHLMQFIYVNGLCLAAALLFPNTLLTFVIVRGIWGLIFTATYKLLSKPMRRNQRLLIYCIVGIPIPLLSYLLYPELGLFEPLTFLGLVVLVASMIEIIYHKQGKK